MCFELLILSRLLKIVLVFFHDSTKSIACYRSLLRHGISIWVDVPLDIVAKEIVEDGIQLLGTEISPSASSSEVGLICHWMLR